MIVFRSISLTIKLFVVVLCTQISVASTCREKIRHVDFRTLEEQAVVSVRSGEPVNAPYWLAAALPEGFEFIAQPLEQAPTGRIAKEMGDFVGVRGQVEIDGQTYSTNVGLSPRTLADNVRRHREGKSKLLTPEGSRAAGVFTHGGGTNLSSFANAANAAVQLVKRAIAVVSFDWFGHGANKADQYPADPSVSYRVVPEFMRKYLPQDIAIVGMGHSMGGQVNDIMMSRLTPEFIEEHYPGLPLRGFVMLSPPADPTGGASLYVKVSRDPEFTNRHTQERLFDSNNMNLEAQEPMTDLQFLMTWNEEMLNRPRLKGFFAMGIKDDVCYLGSQEAAHAAFMQAREGVTSVLYDHVVDAQGNVVEADHMIPKFMRDRNTYDVDSKAMGPTMPWVYADVMRWIEQEVLGNKDFDPFDSHKSEDLSTPKQLSEAQIVKATGKSLEQVRKENAEAVYQQQLASVLELYAKNLVFREFLKNFSFKGRKPLNAAKLVNYNSFLAGLDAFVSEAQVYAKHLQNDRVPFSKADEWTQFFTWVKKSPEERIADGSIEVLFSKWSNVAESASSAQMFASLLIKHLRGQGGFEDVIPILNDLPIKFDNLIASISSPHSVSEAVKQLDTQKRLLVGVRDVDLDALAALNPSLKDEQGRLNKLSEEHARLIDLRKKEVLPRLIVLYAQLVQTQKLFVKYDGTKLQAHGADLVQRLEKLQPLNTDLGFEGALSSFRDLQAQEWQSFAFESLGGPELRTHFSILDRISKDRAKEMKAKKIQEQEAAFLSAWKALAAEFEDIRSQMNGSLDADVNAVSRVRDAEGLLENNKTRALDVLTRFFDYREDFIKLHEGEWTETSRPRYPQEYYDLIAEYKAAQAEYQSTKNQVEALKRELALSGELGVYLQMLYRNLDNLETAIAKINGINQHDEGSLAAIEFQIQSIEHQLEDSQASLVASYVPSLYSVTTLSGWDVLNDQENPPSSADLNRILQAWNRIWRDPTGGQVQDTSQY